MSKKTTDRNAAKREAERCERVGATYRQYAHAVQGTTSTGNFYDMTTEEREAWIERGLAAATLTGLA